MEGRNVFFLALVLKFYIFYRVVTLMTSFPSISARVYCEWPISTVFGLDFLNIY